jgi:NAD(P)H-flavin reductase/ferredoxin
VAAAYRVRVAPGGEEFEVGAGERLLTAARRAGVWLPFECGWGSCGTCKVTVVEGETSSLFAQAPAVHPRDARRARILACQSTAVSDLVLKPAWTDASPRPHLATADYEAELVEVAELAPAIRRFRFQLDRPAAYREGQYAVLELGPDLRRCLSMAGCSGGRSVDFIAKQYAGGRGSECLSRLRLGTVLPVELPYGDMWLRQDDRPVFLIAGGTGVSAILAIAQRLSARADSRPVRAFYGAASEAELVCRQQLASLVDSLPDGQFHTATIQAATNRAIVTGFVTDALAAHAEGLREAQVYLAGPPPMVDAVLSQLRELAVSVENIHYDRFG